MNDENKVVPYYIYEGELVRHERTIKRLIIVLTISIVLLFASNALWLYEWTCYDYVSSVTVDGKDGTANYIGNDGSITNGENSGNEKEDPKETWEVEENKDTN